MLKRYKKISIGYDWTQYSLLKFHPGKCVAMRLKSKSKNNERNCFYNMDQTKLKNVNTENDLGIILDDKLSFEEHINNKVKKANSIAGMLSRSFVHLDKDMFKKLSVIFFISNPMTQEGIILEDIC